MSDTLLDMIGREFGRFLAPLALVADDPTLLDQLMATVGISTPDAERNALLASLTAIPTLKTQIDALLAQPSHSINDVAAVLEISRQAFTALRALGGVVGSSASFTGFGQELASRLITNYLFKWHPFLRSITALMAIQELAEDIEATVPIMRDGELVRGSFSVDHFYFGRLVSLLHDPAAALRSEYGNALATPEDADAMADKLFPRLQRVLRELGVSCRYGFDPDDRPLLGDAAPFLDHALIIYAADKLAGASAEAGVGLMLSSVDRGDLGLVVCPFGVLTDSTQAGLWTIDYKLTADVQAFAIGRNGLTLLAGAGTVEIDGKITATLAAPDSGPAFVLGSPDGSRLEIGGAQLTAETKLSEAKQSLTLSGEVSKSSIVISPGDGDGFLQSVLPANGLQANFDLGLAWSNERGLTFKGAAGLDATLPAGLSIGPVSIQSIHLGLHALDAAVSFECSATAGLSLGPVHILIDRMGLLAGLTFPDQGGNLGVADASLAFKPPSGLGLDIDAGPITGGGFLRFDPAKSEYSGAAQLSIEGVGLSAFGLVQTHPEVSFLVLIATTFPTPIQLGMEFELAGVGGLAGVNRTVSLDALESAVWKGTLNNLLFPTAPITDAAAILSELGTLFPSARGRYVFGITAQIIWGIPPIVISEVGVVLELPEPERIALFGRAAAKFPVEEPTVVLEVEFGGGLDFGTKRLFFDASLIRSRIGIYAITGSLSLRHSWTHPKSTVLAVGGFNPHFQPPAGFPTLSRMALDLSNGPLHLQLSAYLAVTPNTFQVGAAVDLKAHVCDCDVAGHFAFDALFVRKPFSFIIDVDASASISFHGDTFAGVHVSGSLAGPAPWHATGSASISLLFVSVGVSFDRTWGSPSPTQLPAPDPWVAALAPALADPTSWQSQLPAGVHPVVTFAPGDGTSTLLDPAGVITLDEKAVPLNQPIERLGDIALDQPVRFDLAAPSVNGAAVDGADWSPVTNEFAPAQFSNMTDDEKLSVESFVPLVSGFSIGAVAASTGASVGAALNYDLIILDSTRQPGPRSPYFPTRAFQVASGATGPTAQPPWRVVGLGSFAALPGTPPQASLSAPSFVFVSSEDLSAQGSTSATSRYGARLALADYLAQQPSPSAPIQVVPAVGAL